MSNFSAILWQEQATIDEMILDQQGLWRLQDDCVN